MSNETIFNGRQIQKHDTEINWIKSAECEKPFIPKKAELIIFDVDDSHSYERFKIGDGVHNAKDLPFCADYEEIIEDIDARLDTLESQLDVSEISSLTIDDILSGEFIPDPDESGSAIDFSTIDEILNSI